VTLHGSRFTPFSQNPRIQTATIHHLRPSRGDQSPFTMQPLSIIDPIASK
jgi:hypothetical protein